MSRRAEDLLAIADKWARDILNDAHDVHQTDKLVHGWAEIMRSAATAWNAIPNTPAWQANDIATGRPFTQAALIATHIDADAHWAGSRSDERAARISAALKQAAQAIPAQLPQGDQPNEDQVTEAASLRAGLLHIGYLTTHAAATSTGHQSAYLAGRNPQLSQQVSRTAERIRGVEYLLDSHLHRRPCPEAPADPIRALDQALNRVIRAAYSSRPAAGVGTCLVQADIGRDLVANTARLVIRGVGNGGVPPEDVPARLLPVLRTAVQEWEGSRQIWTRMLSPTDRPAADLVAAGTQLQRALRQPDLAGHPAITRSLTSALAVAAELAILNHVALVNPHLTAPAGAVAKMTEEVLAGHSNPGMGLQTWLSMTKIEGPTPVGLPDVLRAHLCTQAVATWDASLAARSAGYALADRGNSSSQIALHIGRHIQTRREPEPPARRDRPAAHRIG